MDDDESDFDNYDDYDCEQDQEEHLPDLQDAFMELIESRNPALFERPFALSNVLCRGEFRSQVQMTGWPRTEWILNGWISDEEFAHFAAHQQCFEALHCSQDPVDPLEFLFDVIGDLYADCDCRPFGIAQVFKNGYGSEGNESVVASHRRQ